MIRISQWMENHCHIVCTFSHSSAQGRVGVGGLNRDSNFKKEGGGLTGSSLLEGFSGKERSDFFQGVLHFSHKK